MSGHNFVADVLAATSAECRLDVLAALERWSGAEVRIPVRPGHHPSTRRAQARALLAAGVDASDVVRSLQQTHGISRSTEWEDVQAVRNVGFQSDC